MPLVVNLNDNSEIVLNSLKSQQYVALDAVGYAAETNVKLLTPVDTGRLKTSFTHVVDDEAVIVGTNVEYGKYVEGNDKARHVTGQAHFLRDGITKNIETYKQIIKSYLTR